MGTGELLGNLTNCRSDLRASRAGGVEILLAASCYGNQDKLWPDEPVLAPKASLTHFFLTFFTMCNGDVRSPNNQLIQLFANNFITKLLKLEMLEADLT